MEEIYRFIAGKVILVTGGGGSIGSELCRQIAKHHPKLLIVFDIYENNAHAIGLELKDKFPNLNLEVLIGSVRDSRRLLQVFEKYKPDVVYHAAAHKHVPLMETSPNEAVKNNVFGTLNVARAAEEFKVDTFVMGNDWEGKFDFLKEHCEVVYLSRTPEISTTQIKKDLGK
jgi:FlaA1/EpsC-like NDP-sugar epimerase